MLISFVSILLYKQGLRLVTLVNFGALCYNNMTLRLNVPIEISGIKHFHIISCTLTTTKCTCKYVFPTEKLFTIYIIIYIY